MNNFSSIEKLLSNYSSPNGAKDFFKGLGYNVIKPLPYEFGNLPEKAISPISAVYLLVNIEGSFPVRIFQVEMKEVKRTDIRRFLEAFYRDYPQGENLFVFTKDYEELYFVSPRRIIDPRDNKKVRLWIRTLPVKRISPYRTDLEILDGIRADGIRAEEIWRRIEE